MEAPALRCGAPGNPAEVKMGYANLQASSKIWKLACDLRELVGGTRLELVTSSVSGKRSPN